MTLSRCHFNKIVDIEYNENEERAWHFIHLDPEIILLGNWYRPGTTCHDNFEGLDAGLQRLTPEATSVILTGDLNVHHSKWLRFSNGNTAVGADLRIISENFGLQQVVQEATRGPYLLDLFLIDIAGTKVEVGPQIADHKFLLAHVPCPEIRSLTVVRKGYNLRRAK